MAYKPKGFLRYDIGERMNGRWGADISLNAANGINEYFAAWYLPGCDFGFYIFRKHFVVWARDGRTLSTIIVKLAN